MESQNTEYKSNWRDECFERVGLLLQETEGRIKQIIAEDWGEEEI